MFKLFYTCVRICSYSLVLITLSHCQKKMLKATPEPSPAQDLQISMAHLKYELDQTIPYLLNPKEFHNPEKNAFIESRLLGLTKISSQVSHEPSVQNRDPVLSFLSVGFQEEIARSLDAFKQGYREYARVNLLHVSSYCIECHTRTKSGPSLDTNAIQSTWSTMRPIDQLEYLVSTRQFEKARHLSMTLTQEGLSSQTNVFDLDRIVRLGLLITVRYEQNPDHALNLVETLEKINPLPFYLKVASVSWKKQILSWKSRYRPNPKPQSSSQNRLALPVARELIERMNVSPKTERYFEIDMLRVQALLNPTISHSLDSESLGESLYLLGISYEVTKDLALWSLHESYFEACVRKLPGSKWANKCYESLEKSLYFGYTGTRGTFLPPDVENKLKELKKMTTL
jgi:hypothetical protein